MSGLFEYPTAAAVSRLVAKSRIYHYARPPQAVRELFVAQVREITWAYKLAPETINLPPRDGVSEIQVFHLDLKQSELEEAVLRTIDRAISFPIMFELRRQGRTKPIAAYKRPNDANADKRVIESYFQTDWQPEETERAFLPVALDLSQLYTQMLRSLIPLAPRPGETLHQQTERLTLVRSKERQVRRAEARLRRERQFNHKVAVNAELHRLRAELERLLE